jgi:adenylate kinase family enzyme
MLLLFIGPSCSGKSSVAKKIAERTSCKVWSGKDYFRLAKNQDEAWKIFLNMLRDSSSDTTLSDKSIIFLISNPIELRNDLLAISNLKSIKFNADISVLKQRLAKRINQEPLSPPLEKMIERQQNAFQTIPADKEFDTTTQEVDIIANNILVWYIKGVV